MKINRVLANLIHERTGILVDDQSIFDVQVKRFMNISGNC